MKRGIKVHGSFVVSTPEDVLPGIKRLRAGKSVTVLPTMRPLFEHEARKNGLVITVKNDGLCYEFKQVGGNHAANLTQHKIAKNGGKSHAKNQSHKTRVLDR